MNVTNHAVVRYLERELRLQFGGCDKRTDRDSLRIAEKEQRVDVEAIRRVIKRVFESPRMENVVAWTKGAPYRVIVGPRVYHCRGGTVITFYRAFRK